MISNTQLEEIRHYLLSKKLPLDILLEVQDRFISQIHHLQSSENLDFNIAFHKAKETWLEELSLSWLGSWDLMDSTNLVRKINKQIVFSNLEKTFYFTSCYIVFLFGMVSFFYYSHIATIILILFFIPSIFALLYYIYHYSSFKLIKQYNKYVLTLQQEGIYYFALFLAPLSGILVDVFQNPDKFLKLFSLPFNFNSIFIFIMVLITLYIIIGGAMYSIICQINYLKQIKKIKPFLIYIN